jgi:hypothetical protein
MKMKPIPKGNKGLAKLSKPVRNNMGYMARGGKTKGYAYGSMVRNPMASENNMMTSFNPMQPREQAGMQPPVDKKMTGMMYGGKAKKKNGY